MVNRLTGIGTGNPNIYNQEVIDGINNVVYGTSPPVGTAFPLIISTTFGGLLSPELRLTFTGPVGETFIANPADVTIGQDVLTLQSRYPPNTWLEYNNSSPSLFDRAGDWTVTLSIGNQSFPTTTFNMVIGTNQPLLQPAIKIQTRAPLAYTAQGVLFTGSISNSHNPTYLECGGLTGVDEGVAGITYSMWVNGLFTFNNGHNGGVCWASDSENTNDASMVPNGTDGGLSMGFYSGAGANQYQPIWNANLFLSGWNHLLFSAFYGAAGFSSLYINEVLTPPSVTNTRGGAVGTIPWNGKSFFFGDDFSGFDGPTFQAADVWINPGQVIVLPDGTISEANRRIFTDKFGNPQNIDALPPAAVIFSGDAGNFPINRGTGGAFAQIGSLITTIGPGGTPT